MYICTNAFVYIGLFLFLFHFVFSCSFSLYLYVFIKKNFVNFIYLMTCFDCFGLVGKLEFRVCAVKTSETTFFWRYDETSDFPFQEIPSGLDNENSEATLQNTIYQGFLSKNLKIGPLRPPYLPLYQCCRSVNCPQHGLGVICRPINIDQRGGRENFCKKIFCLNILCDWLKGNLYCYKIVLHCILYTPHFKTGTHLELS